MLREVLPRLAESVSDPSDELRNYVVEIMLSLENALNNSQEESLHPPGYSPEGHGRQVSDITPLPGEQCTVYFSVCPIWCTCTVLYMYMYIIALYFMDVHVSFFSIATLCVQYYFGVLYFRMYCTP